MPIARRLLTGLAVAAGIWAAAGCGTSPPAGQAEPTRRAAVCRAPLQGQRFAVCGHLAMTGLTGPTTGTWVVGAVDATTRAARSRYAVQGGTFHASR